MSCNENCDNTYMDSWPYLNYLDEFNPKFEEDKNIKTIVKHREILDTISLFKGHYWKDPKELFVMRNHISYNEFLTYDTNGVLIDHKFYPLNCSLTREDSIGVNCWRIENSNIGDSSVYTYYELNKFIEKRIYLDGKIVYSQNEFFNWQYKYDEKGQLTEEGMNARRESIDTLKIQR